MTATPRQAIAFAGSRLVASGTLPEVARAARRAATRASPHPILVFDAETSEVIELDLRGSEAEVLGRLEPAPHRSPGRPKLGVIAREVTLLPRHWDWLADQPGGASVTLRKLVDQARVSTADADRLRKGKEAAYRFIAAMAGNRPGFEEATRALFAGDRQRFNRLVANWPAGIKTHAIRLMAKATA